MAVNKVDLYVSQILEDLDNGLTWLKSDDIGYGSIQEKYNAKEQQIVMIRKHPALKDAETNITVFNIIDDTKDERTTSVPVDNSSNAAIVGNISETMQHVSATETKVPGSTNGNTGETFVTADADELSAFVNL